MRSIKWIIKLTLTAGLLFYLAEKSQLNFSLLLEVLKNPALLVLILILYIFVLAISSLRWKRINDQIGVTLNYRSTFMSTYLGVSFNNLLPGGISGDFYRYFYLHQSTNAPRSLVMTSILADRLLGFVGVFYLLGTVALINFNQVMSIKVIYYISLFSIMVMIGSILLASIHQYVFKKNMLPFLEQKSIVNHAIFLKIKPLINALMILSRSSIMIFECIVLSVIIQFFIALTCLLLANIMHYPSYPLSYFGFAASITQVVNLIPITPGGFGIGEIAFSKIMTLFTEAKHIGFATIFIAYRFLGVLLYLPSILIVSLNKPAAENQCSAEQV